MSDLYAPPRSCPDASVLAAYVEGKLDRRLRREVERHVADCPDCPTVIAETVHFLRNEVDEGEGDIDSPSRAPLGRFAIAAGVAALCVVGVVWQDVIKRDPLRSLKQTAANAKARTVEGRLADFEYAPFIVSRSGRKPAIDLALRAEAERLQKSHASSVRTLHARGVALLLTGDVPSALHVLDAVSRRAPNDAKVQSDLAVAYIAAGHGSNREPFRRALSAAEAAIAISPSLAAAHFNRAVALEHLGRPSEAVDAYRHVIEMESRSSWRDESLQRVAQLQP